MAGLAGTNAPAAVHRNTYTAISVDLVIGLARAPRKLEWMRWLWAKRSKKPLTTMGMARIETRVQQRSGVAARSFQFPRWLPLLGRLEGYKNLTQPGDSEWPPTIGYSGDKRDPGGGRRSLGRPRTLKDSKKADRGCFNS
jgi:hypothetical protein